jgi:tRNA (adenine57-N1/adenine58-N1)-methyltransferase
MDFALKHLKEDGIAVQSKIRVLPTTSNSNSGNNGSSTLTMDDKLIAAANQAARDLFDKQDDDDANAELYPERILPTTSIIEPGALIVIFESFDSLTFCYAKPGERFNNRNGCFPHDDFIGKHFGSIVRSKDNRGYGFVYLLKPTPELWARSLTHRTQIVHELDASMICHYLELRPNMVVCESGTGSGALSHAILRSIAPHGKLFTYEFNESRAIQARTEFVKNGVSHLVDVAHRDVCGKDDKGGGFGLGRGQRAHAVMLDLPEPWLAVPHAAHVLKRGGRIASYSPCVEQAQRCIAIMKERGFHSIRTLEFRLREHYVDEVDLWSPPKDKRPRLELNEMHHLAYVQQQPGNGSSSSSNKNNNAATETKECDDDDTTTQNKQDDDNDTTKKQDNDNAKKRKMICARPFNNMRGHTAFLTFATAGNAVQPDPCCLDKEDDSKK